MIMREMKDSGISWVGEIPKEWRCLPIRALFTENRNKNFLGKETKALQFKYGTIVPKKNFDPEENYVAETILNYNIVDRGMIMLNGLNLNFDFVSKRIALVAERGIITSAYMSFYPTDTTIVLSEYANYLLKSYDNCAAFHNMGGGVRKILNFDELKRQYFVLPPLAEQQRIAEVLDRKCAKIDGLKADIQVQIDTLEQYKRSVITEAVTHGLNPSAPMKDSGINYISEHPIHWSLRRLKYILNERNERSVTGTEELLSVSLYKGVIPSTEMTNRTMQADSLIGYKRVYKGDLVFNKLNPGMARFGCSDYDGITSPDFAVYIVNENYCNAKFLQYLLKTDFYVEKIKSVSMGVGDGFTRLYSNQLYEFFVALPPRDEVSIIINYLDNKCAEIEQIIADKKTQIETLDGYKKSLIYEYVTGKKEVG